MRHAVDKVRRTGNTKIILTERGTTFGYHNLVADMRSIAIMKEGGWPVVFDATHSVQRPGAGAGRSLGDGHYAPLLAKAALAAGADGLFFETHPHPADALSDGPNMIPLDDVPALLPKLAAIHEAANS